MLEIELYLLGLDWLDGHWHFAAHGLQDGDHHFVTGVELLLDFVQQVLVVVAVEVVTDVAALVHETQVALLGNVDQVVLNSRHVWHFHVVGGWRHIFVLLSVEDVDSYQVDLGVTVLAGFRGGHIYDLAWLALEHSITVLS